MKNSLLALTAIFLLSSCNIHTIYGSGNIITENRKTALFTGIDAGGSFEVVLKNGPQTEVVVESDDNVIGNIETKVTDGVLHIGFRRNGSFTNALFKVYVTMPDVSRIDLGGASTLTTNGLVKSTGKLEVEADGASHVDMELDAPEVALDASGASQVKLKGRTKTYTIDADGSSDVKSADLLAETVTVDVSGASTADVFASVQLKIDADGASHVNYRGEAKVESKTGGAASVEKK